jgi:hypothetical protein
MEEAGMTGNGRKRKVDVEENSRVQRRRRRQMIMSTKRTGTAAVSGTEVALSKGWTELARTNFKRASTVLK